MHDEENGHRHRLISLYREHYGEHIPLIRRSDVKGFIARKPLWLNKILTISMIRNEVESMEQEARNFYRAAIPQTSDAAVRQLLGDLAAEEDKHYALAEEMDEKQKASGVRQKEDDSEKSRFVLQIVQPGLAGLMDGSVCGLMTSIGGVGHTLPFLIASFYYAMCLAVAIVVVELGIIAWIRHRFIDTPLLSAAFQVIVGGTLVFIVGILIGSA